MDLLLVSAQGSGSGRRQAAAAARGAAPAPLLQAPVPGPGPGRRSLEATILKKGPKRPQGSYDISIYRGIYEHIYMYTIDSKRLECGNRISYACFSCSLALGLEDGRNCSSGTFNFGCCAEDMGAWLPSPYSKLAQTAQAAPLPHLCNLPVLSLQKALQPPPRRDFRPHAQLAVEQRLLLLQLLRSLQHSMLRATH